MKSKILCAPGVKPPLWPTGWPFPPDKSLPPGYPHRSFYAQKLHVFNCADDEYVIQVRNVFGEDDDELNGQLLHVRAFDGEGHIRLRQTPAGPWYESAVFPIRNYLNAHNGIAEKVFFDLARVKKKHKTLNVLFDLWGFTPRMGVGVQLKVSELT